MDISELDAQELLAAARPILDNLIAKRLHVPSSRQEKLILQKLELILHTYGYEEQLLKKACWSYKHLAFLQGRLAFYEYCEEYGVPIPY